jgi:alcohol dehydrogenase class IV
MASALPRLSDDPMDRTGRWEALYGAWLCGIVLGQVSIGLHHKLCHTLGGSFDLPHAETHAVMLPHTMAYNSPAAPEAMHRLARALGAKEGPAGLRDLLTRLRVPSALRELGMPESGLDRVADLALLAPYPNPRPLDKAAIRALLQRAFEGSAPLP